MSSNQFFESLKTLFLAGLLLFAKDLQSTELEFNEYAFETLVSRHEVSPKWFSDEKSLFYTVKTNDGSTEYVLVELPSGSIKRGKSLEEISLQYDSLFKHPVEAPARAKSGPDRTIEFRNSSSIAQTIYYINNERIENKVKTLYPFKSNSNKVYEGHIWKIQSKYRSSFFKIPDAGGILTITDNGIDFQVTYPQASSTSPSNLWKLELILGSLVIKNLETGESKIILKNSSDSYTLANKFFWSPSSSSFISYGYADIETRKLKLPHEITQKEPTETVDYPLPGDPIIRPELSLFCLAEGGVSWKQVKIDSSLFPAPFALSSRDKTGSVNFQWRQESKEFIFHYNQRGHQLYRVIAVDSKTGKTRTLISETSNTLIDYGPNENGKGSKIFFHQVKGSGEVIWMSERSDWAHLWLYDLNNTNSAPESITSGEWVVRQVLDVDDKKREIWFLASGLRVGEDPYHRHLCRVNFDGSGLTRLTDSYGDHSVTFSPSKEWIIAKWSRADHPPVHELRNGRSGDQVAILEKADITKLLKTGWQLPVRFSAFARDKKTKVYGIIIKPWEFDPAISYPIVEKVYAGPQGSYAPKTFDILRLGFPQFLASDGMVVVQVDGMGTNHRGKIFRDISWRNLGDAGFPDRISWIKTAGKTRPWMNLERVGIYGGSLGGQNAVRALLDYNDFYSVAVADCGCHDNKMDKLVWTEKWMGWPVDEKLYRRSSNIEDASKLKGELLIIVGEMDENVAPIASYKLKSELEKYSKEFEFRSIPDQGHGAGNKRDGAKLRHNFLIDRLLKKGL